MPYIHRAYPRPEDRPLSYRLIIYGLRFFEAIGTFVTSGLDFYLYLSQLIITDTMQTMKRSSYMKRLYLLILSAVVGFSAIRAGETIDSLSYATGYMSTLSLMAGENKLMQNREDFENFIHGLEDNLYGMELMSDSSYMISYVLGAMQGTFMTDGINFEKKESLPRFDCIISGLRKVADGDITLPADTIAAKTILEKYGHKGTQPEDLDADTRCKFFTSYGIMKAFAPGLQKYIQENIPGTKCIENRQAFAAGMADILEPMTRMPKDAYDLGKTVARSLFISGQDSNGMDFPSFIAGAKAALGLGLQLIPREKVEQIIWNEKFISADELNDTSYNVKELDLQRLDDLTNRLDVDLGKRYRVDWNVTVCPVADVSQPCTKIFLDILRESSISSEGMSQLIIHKSDVDVLTCLNITDSIKRTPLPEGYKWFCRSDTTGLTIGIIDKSREFNAKVNEAYVDYNKYNNSLETDWKFNAADAKKWEKFTEGNLGKKVATEINGVFLSAPMVMNIIDEGACSLNGLSIDEINSLFKNAGENPDHTPDTFEVIEIN